MGLLSAGAARLRESGPALRLVEGDAADRPEDKTHDSSRRRRARGPGAIPAVTMAVVLMIAGAVTLQAQRVAGQDSLESVRTEMRDADRLQAELRASVAESEAPEQILLAAGDLGMVEPAATVAVPAPVAGAVGVADRG